MVRCVVDRRCPDLAQVKLLGDRDERRQPPPHGSHVRPVDRAGWCGRSIRIAHPKQQTAILKPPVETAGDIEGHGTTLALEGRIWPGRGTLVAPGTRRT